MRYTFQGVDIRSVVLLVGLSFEFTCAELCLTGSSCKPIHIKDKDKIITTFDDQSSELSKDFEQCDHVGIFKCGYVCPPCFYHRIMNCIVPSFLTYKEFQDRSKQHKNNCIFIDAALDEFVDMLKIPTLKKIHYNSSMTNYTLNKNVNVTFGLDDESKRKEAVESLRAMFKDESSDGTPTILTHNRVGHTRTFQHYNHVIELLKSQVVGARFVEYDAKMSMLETFRLFSKATVYVHYHGASGANTVMMPNNSLVIEISTFDDNHCDKPWRTNKVVSKWFHPSKQWIVHRIPLRQVNIDDSLYGLSKDRDHIIKDAKTINITPCDIINIASIINAWTGRST